ncbi:hypothetical protein AAFF_G00179190 [Aldrovandia affinis]|uniref:Uncharacterized protein n=1 Tax=Aldrovandia affinis TaxID=143900 RepID=A0AAD7VXE5_9TELE|nr:hypothetical protein AAFF_G00179190 [Aldrovandia affinis]
MVIAVEDRRRRRSGTLRVRHSPRSSPRTDNQPTVTIKAHKVSAHDQRQPHAGHLRPDEHPPQPAGAPDQRDLEIDVNVIPRWTAEDKGTGNMNKITITNDQNPDARGNRAHGQGCRALRRQNTGS